MLEGFGFIGATGSSSAEALNVGYPSLVDVTGATQLYLDVFRRCSQIYDPSPASSRVTHFRVISTPHDTTMYLNVFQKYADAFTRPKAYSLLCARSSGEGRRGNVLPANHAITAEYQTSLAGTLKDTFRRSSTLFAQNPTTQQTLTSVVVSISASVPALCPAPASVSSVGCMRASRQRVLEDASASVSGSRKGRRANRAPSSTTAAAGDTDFGDCDQTCRYGGASFWHVERLKGHSNSQRPTYHSCCGGGSIHMPPARDPNNYIRSLFLNKQFMENIRAYNQMFSMTSLGAMIDDSINTSRGPYVFKLSDQVYHWIGSLYSPPGEPPRFLQIYIYDTDNEIENRLRHFDGIDNSGLDTHVVEGLIHFLDAHDELV